MSERKVYKTTVPNDTSLTPENIEAVAKGIGGNDYTGHQAVYRAKAVDAILRARRIDAEGNAMKAMERLIRAMTKGQEA